MGKPTIAVGNRRLLKLADFLEKLPAKRFDFDNWVGSDWEGAPNLSCGTTACALGWATAMPEFRRLGLKLDSEGWPSCAGRSGAYAAESIFALEGYEAEVLFTPVASGVIWLDIGISSLSGATRQRMVAHIRKFVRLREKHARKTDSD